MNLFSNIKAFPSYRGNLNARQRANGAKSRPLLSLFLAFAIYTAFPIFDVPFIGISLSAPVFYFIALEFFFRQPLTGKIKIGYWPHLATLIFMGIVLSGTANAILSGGETLHFDEIIIIIRYGYWLLIFTVTAYIIAASDVGPRLVNFLSVAILITTLMRWFEALVWGKIGAWEGTKIFMQNTYGLLFSTYSILLLFQAFKHQNKLRIVWWLGLLSTWGVIAINGSRGSWVSIAFSISIFLLLDLFTDNQRLKGFIWAAGLAGIFSLFIAFAPYQAKTKVLDRFSTFHQLDQDKSYMIRQLMIQKAVKLFSEEPIWGVGPNRFRKTFILLDLPEVLQYGTQEHFNRKSAHNSYIDFLAEMGLAGSLPLAILLALLIFAGGHAAIRLAKTGEFWAIAIYVAFLSMSVHFWVIASLTNTSTWLMYGIIAGIITRARQFQQKPIKPLANAARSF